MGLFPLDQPQGLQPGLHLSESVLLPLIGGTVSEEIRFLDELPHRRWAVGIFLDKLSGDVGVALFAFRQLEQRLAIRGERLQPAGVIADAVIDIVGVLLLMPVLDGIALHGQKSRDRGDRDLDAVLAARGHRAVDRHHLIKLERKIGAVCALNGKILNEGRLVLGELDMARHQEIDDHVDGRAAVVGDDLSHELKLLELGALVVAVLH